MSHRTNIDSCRRVFKSSKTSGRASKRHSKIRGITKRKRIEDEPKKHDKNLARLLNKRIAELERTETRFQRYIKEANDLIFTLDVSGKITSANQATSRATGYSVDELLGKDPLDFIAPEARASVRAALRKVTRGEHVQRVEAEIISKDGRRISLEVRGHLIHEGKRRVDTFYVARDITNRKQTEEAMLRQADLLQKTFDSMTDAVFTLDAKLPVPTILDCNVAASTIFGHDKDEMLGKTTAFLHISDETLREFQSLLYSAVEEGRLPFRLPEFHMKRKDGSVFPSEHAVSQLVNDRGERIAWVSVVRDITEHKLMGEKVAHLNRLYSVVSKTSEAIVRVRDPERLYAEICRIAVEDGLFRMAWIGLVDPDTFLVKPVAHWGVEEGYLGKIMISVKEVPEGLGPTSIAIRKGRPYVCNDIEHDLGMERARNEALKRGYRSTAAFPLRAEGRILGALVLYSKELHFFNDEEIQLLEALTDDLSFASQSVEHEKERKRAEDRLAKINECFLSFGPNPTGNIDRLTALCGEMMEATSAFYNRLEGGVLRSVGQWQAPPDYTPVDKPEGHICYDVIRSAEEDVLVIRDLAHTQYAKTDPNVSRYRLQTYVGKAVKFVDTYVGSLCVVYQEDFIPSEADKRILGILASAISVEEERLQAEEAVRRRAEELAALQSTVLDITGRHDLPTLLRTIVERAARLLDTASGGLYLCDPERREVRCIVSYNTPSDYTGIVLKYGEGAAGVVAETGKPLIIDDYRKWQGRAVVYEREKPFVAVLSTPMVWQGRLTGVIHLHGNVESRRFTQADLELLTLFANHAAIAVENARLLENMRQSEQQYRSLFDSASDAILIHDMGARFLEVNEVACESLGYSREELLQMTPADIDSPEYATTVRRRVEELRKVGHAFFETAHVRRDGTVLPVELSSRIIEYKGKPAVLSIARDISERKKAEDEITRERDRAQTYLDVAGVMMVAIGAEGRVTLLNRKGCEILGCSQEEALGKNWFDNFVPAAVRYQVRTDFRSLMSGKIEPVEYFENPILTRSGEERLIAWHNTLLKDAEGRVIGTLSSGNDITDRKRMEEELKRYSTGLEQLVLERTKKLAESERRLQYVITSNPAVIYAGKPLADYSDFVLTYLSERVVSMLGFEPQDFIGHPEFWERHVPPEDVRSVQAEMPRLWKEAQHTFEYRFMHKDGTYRWIREEAKVVRDADGKPIEINGYWTDVTERKRLEEELAKSQRLATIGELAAMVGHDLRNPLTGIVGASYYLKVKLGPKIGGREKEMLDLIQQGVERSNEIINDLLDYSRELRLELTETSVRSITKQALAGVKIPAQISVVDLSEDEPRMVLDGQKIRRVLVNLIENAVDAMPRGGTLTIASTQSNGKMQISFTDTGVGIPAETMQKIGTPLFTTKAKGIGLGLPICKRIVEAHRGTITLESKAGKGTTVTITLPLKET